MSISNDKVLVVIGVGPGIGLATAKLFAAKGFTKVALMARDKQRLNECQAEILQDVEQQHSEMDVRCWGVDITDPAAFRSALEDVQTMGKVSCVLFNAARVAPSDLLEFPEDEIVKDFLTTNIALYTAAKWAVPLLRQELDRPTLLVTSSVLWREPYLPCFSLSMVKSSQRNLVQSLQETYTDIHIAMLYVAGPVSPDDKVRSPNLIAEKYWELYSESKASWSRDMEI